MTQSPDLSIAQRLGIGFGLLFTVVLCLLALFYNWHATAARAQADYSERIAPLRDRIVAVERNAYRVGIALRAALAEPSAERFEALEASTDQAHAALDALGRSNMEPQERRAYRQIAEAMQAFIARAQALARERRAGEINANDEIVRMREAVVGPAGNLGDVQERKAVEALAAIETIRERTSAGLTAMAVLTAIVLAALGWATARSVSAPARRLVRTAGALEHGDWKPALRLIPSASQNSREEPRDEMKRLANAIGSAAAALERREQRLRADGLVSKAVAATLERKGLADNALKAVVDHLGAAVGVVYGCEPDGHDLEPIASYALNGDLRSLSLGEGVPGQAARDRRTLVVSDIPADCGFSVRFGYDEAPPRALAAVPLLFRGHLHGVLLVGSLRSIDTDAVAFLEASAMQLGVGLQNVAVHEHVQRLLADVRESNERIQAQNEELQVQNEEIQAQNEEIQAQTQQLQVQHEEIQAQNEELMQQSEELRRHAAALAEADERKTKFLGVLAHELRNPMAPIATSLAILKRSEPGSSGAQRAQAIIERQTLHLVRLIDDLLDVTRISEGKIQLRRERLDLIELVRSCVEDLAVAFEQSGIVLDLDLPNAPVDVDADRTRLCQVLGNLLNNSIKFSDGGSRVTLSLRVDHSTGAAVVRVIDAGIGMEPDLLPLLFQPFSQGISGLARTNGGLGLGLALVKALVVLHEGSVEAHSEGPGRGAEFTVRIPLASADAALKEQLTVRPANPAPDQGVAVRRVLVIEDNLDAAHSLREALELDRYEVVVAHSGDEGIALAHSFMPDVVLCDVGLPGLDGYEVARRLRADPRTQGALLIALTGYASDVDRQQAHAAGFDVHLPKPLDVSSFPGIVASARGRAE